MSPIRLYLQAMERVFVGTPLHANALSPGDMQIASDVFADPGGVPIVDRATGSFSFGSGAGLIAGNYCEEALNRSELSTTLRLASGSVVFIVFGRKPQPA